MGEAERLKTETANLLSEAQAERDRAREETKRAERDAERVVSEAREKAQELLDQARLAAQQESTDLRRQLRVTRLDRCLVGHLRLRRRGDTLDLAVAERVLRLPTLTELQVALGQVEVREVGLGHSALDLALRGSRLRAHGVLETLGSALVVTALEGGQPSVIRATLLRVAS